MKICPNCVEYLKADKKNFGGCKNWLVCPVCGYRMKLMDESKAEHIHLIGDIMKGANSHKQYIEQDPGKDRNNK